MWLFHYRLLLLYNFIYIIFTEICLPRRTDYIENSFFNKINFARRLNNWLLGSYILKKIQQKLEILENELKMILLIVE